MVRVGIELWSATKDLFPSKKHLRMVIGLVTLATIVSISELLLARLFSDLILPSEPRSSSNLIVLSVIFLGVFGLLRIINFIREYYRLNVFEKALTEDNSSRFANSWKWATAMELTALLTLVGRFVFISILLFYFSVPFGLCNLALSVILFQTFALQMKRQYTEQRKFRKLQFEKKPVTNAEKVKTRILAGESISLISALGMLLMFGALILFSTRDVIEPTIAFTLFIALRMIGQVYAGFSSGLMRYVRARVYCE